MTHQRAYQHYNIKHWAVYTATLFAAAENTEPRNTMHSLDTLAARNYYKKNFTVCDVTCYNPQLHHEWNKNKLQIAMPWSCKPLNGYKNTARSLQNVKVSFHVTTVGSNGEVLAWLSVWSEVQTICIWSSWCHCHPIISCSSKIQNDLPFWCRLTQVVLEKRLLNGCRSTRSTLGGCLPFSEWIWTPSYTK